MPRPSPKTRERHSDPPRPRPVRKPGRQPPAHEGATEAQVDDRTGSGAGYDLEPTKEQDDGGVED